MKRVKVAELFINLENDVISYEAIHFGKFRDDGENLLGYGSFVSKSNLENVVKMMIKYLSESEEEIVKQFKEGEEEK